MAAPTGTGVGSASGPTMLDLPRIQEVVTLPAAVAAVEDAFLALSRGHVIQPPPVSLDLPAGEVHVKSAQLAPHQAVVVKIATGFPANPSRGLPPGDGALLLLDPDTGQLSTVLLDRGWLTDVRTAAVTSTAVRHLSVGRPRQLALLGTGTQADLTLRTLAAVNLLPDDVRIWGRHLDRAQLLADRHRSLAPRIHAVPTGSDAVQDADLVITVTAARAPVLRGRWLAPDVLVVAVGADSPGKRECDLDVLQRADHLITDHRDQANRLGELQHIPPDLPTAHRVIELADLIANGDQRPANGIRLCDLTGVGATDAAIAALALA